MSRRYLFPLLLCALTAASAARADSAAAWTPEQWNAILHDLASDSYKTRAAATAKLQSLDTPSIYALQSYAQKTADPEVKSRLLARADELLDAQLIFEAQSPVSIKFGEPLIIKASLVNHRPTPIHWPAGTVSVDCSQILLGRMGYGSSGLEITGATDPTKDTTIPASGRIDFEIHVKDLSGVALGDGVIQFDLRGNSATQQLWQNRTQLSVSFEIAPSDFIQSLWSATSKDDTEKVRIHFLSLLKYATSGEEYDQFQHLLLATGPYAIPYLRAAAADPDPAIRKQALIWLTQSSNDVGQFNMFLQTQRPLPVWAQSLALGNQLQIQSECMQTALHAVRDPDNSVKAAALNILSMYNIHDAVPQALTLLKDKEPDARRAALQYLSRYTHEKDIALAIVPLLSDADENVHNTALNIFRGPFAPPPEVIAQAFAQTHDPVSTSLIPLLLEREDPHLPDILAPHFDTRTAPERLAILSALAGHTDDTTLHLIAASLADSNQDVQRLALQRLLPFPAATAAPLLANYGAPATLAPLVTALADEIHSHKIFPFLAAAPLNEIPFPSQNACTPLVSPDGKWIAYTEIKFPPVGNAGRIRRFSTGYPVTHIVQPDGSHDLFIGELSPTNWLADSSHLGLFSSDFALIVDLKGNITTQFGDSSDSPAQIPQSQIASPRLLPQINRRVPAVPQPTTVSFSSDGKFFGPYFNARHIRLLDADHKTIDIPLDNMMQISYAAASAFSPDNRYLLAAESSAILIVDLQTQKASSIPNLTSQQIQVNQNRSPVFQSNAMNPWQPWSADSKHFAYIDQNQIWIADSAGQNRRQLTFDPAPKSSPIFSPDGSRIAYITTQPMLYPLRPAPSDLWLVDIQSTLAVRLTQFNAPTIHSVNWLSNTALIFDRGASTFGPGGMSTTSSLQTLSLIAPQLH